jgi:photosystem II stability/assembly factor-like uncharacterized protein
LTGLADATTGQIGINTITPTATLDIRGGGITTFNVQSQQTTNRNILAQNTNHRGVVVQTTDASSALLFYNYRLMNQNTGIDAVIQNHNTGRLEIDASYVDIQAQTTIQANQATTTAYKNNYYDISMGRTLTALTEDLSSMTFFHINTAAGKGTQWGGGVYPYDATRQFGTWGYTDPSNTYIPAQSIVSGSHPAKWRTTTGINTYQPRVDQCVVDINGPVHITNNSITTVFDCSFEVKAVMWTGGTTGLAVGSPSTTAVPFVQNVATTTNGGKTWRTRNINQGDLQNLSVVFRDAWVYDSSNAAVVGDNGFVFASADGMATWNLVSLPPLLTGVQMNSVVANTSDSGAFLLLCFTALQDTLYSMALVYSASVYYFSTPTTITNKKARLYKTNNTTFNIYSLGYNNGGSSVDSSANMIHCYTATDASFTYINSYTDLTTAAFTDLVVLDATHAVAVGANAGQAVIAMTLDGGTTWTAQQPVAGALNAVWIDDEGHGVAVGDAGLVLYTADYTSLPWSAVSVEQINGGGNATVLTEYDLMSITIVENADAWVLTARHQIYGAGFRQGDSRLLYIYIPALFNNAADSILDLCGNEIVSGNIIVEQKMAVGYTCPVSLDADYTLDVSGTINATHYNTSSDYRIKENIELLDEKYSVDPLRPCKYYNTQTQEEDIGFIAHEVQEHYPCLVKGAKDGAHLQSLNYMGLMGIVVRELQDLKERVRELETAATLTKI